MLHSEFDAIPLVPYADVDDTPMSSLRKRATVAKKYRCNTLICVLENPQTIANVCQVIRTIDNLGVGKLYVVDKCNLFKSQLWTNFKNDKTLINLSVSAIKYVYVRTFNTTEACIDHLEKKGYISIVTSPHVKKKENIELKEGNYTNKKLAIWFGNESTGITEDAIKKANACVQIKMVGITESLNLSVCAGIVLHEIISQRQKFLKK